MSAATGELAAQLTLDQLALLAEFESDEEATAKILEALTHGYTAEYVAERIRQDRAEAAEHGRLVVELEAAGTPVTAELLAGAGRITDLVHEGEDLTPEAHATCPGRGVYFPSWNQLHAVHYCTSPAGHGHTGRYAGLTTSTDTTSVGAGSPTPLPTEDADGGGSGDVGVDPGRRLVIEGNKAWAAAAEVRKRWLRQLFARRAAPKEAARFVASQLLTMPEPLRLGLPGAYAKPVFSEVTGHQGHQLLTEVDTCPTVRVPLLMLAPIVAAYESEMYGTDAGRRSTWREDRYSPCSRTQAGKYLTFLASLGYQLAPIEQAVADGDPYTGDNPADALTTDEESGQDPGTASGTGDTTPGESESADGDAPGDTDDAPDDGASQDAPPAA